MMLVSTPPKLGDNSMSPNYHNRHYTPPRSSAQQYDSPMLTPSPLRQTTINASLYDPLQSPCKSTAQAQPCNPFFTNMPQPILADDEEGMFLSSAPSDSFTPFFSPASAQPLRTPVKQVHRTRSRSILSPKPMNTIFGSIPPSVDSKCATRVGVGTKRKSTPHATPLRQHNLTPLKLVNAQDSSMSPSFDRLAPLAAPKFTTRTPQTKAETDAYLKRQTASMTKLKISDNNILSDDEFEGVLNDSGCEMDDEDPGNILFLSKQRLGMKATQPLKSLVLHPPVSKGKEKEEVAEAISPGGHIVKRRARSRPVSAELLESTFKSPKSPIKSAMSMKRNSNTRLRNAVAFPGTAYRGHASPASSSDAGSPRARRRISGNTTLVQPQTSQLSQIHPPRAPLSRIESASSATLFFGPPIPPTQTLATIARSRINTNLSAATPAPVLRRQNTRANLTNRHSYAGPESSVGALHVWNTVQTRNVSPSPGSSPCRVGDSSHHRDTDMEEDEDIFFGPQDSSFILNVTGGTPSPQSKGALPMKFKHRNSLLVSDEDEMLSTGSSVTEDFLQAMPKASTSVSSICSDDGLVTPGAAPDSYLGWPTAAVYNGADEAGDNRHPYGLIGDAGIDAFIIKTLAAASKGPQVSSKKVPGTPVKKVRMCYFGNERPWQSAVASKVGLRDDPYFNKKVPRKSLPAVFPLVAAKASKSICDQNTDSEDEQESPISRRDEYANLGLGQPPPVGKNVIPGIPRSQWLMRRSSSGAFSSGSDSASLSSTPTRSKGIDWHLPKPRIPLRLPPSSDAIKVSSPRSNSGSSCSSIATLHSPTNGKRSTAPSSGRVHLGPRPTLVARRLSDSFAEEQPGRFERDFVEIEEVGSGEFGKVIKVMRKSGDDVELYAIKKSKRFEGAKHRLRLREEVEVLKHLSQASLSTHSADGRHPNVLAYIDSWEEDEALYIRTELCESGNLARFLWEYGRVFLRLDEARVWKVIVDLSNGLRFIHDSGVIHLDLKPSNVFVTKEGRFKIGDFGMASFWPRPRPVDTSNDGDGRDGNFEREGDKLYLAPEVLQGQYGKAADMFSFGMMILETASNIVVPDQGEAWHRLRREDFSQVDLDESVELVSIIKEMMRTDPRQRMSADEVCAHAVVARTRVKMEEMYESAKRKGTSVFVASPLASVPRGFLDDVLCGMDI